MGHMANMAVVAKVVVVVVVAISCSSSRSRSKEVVGFTSAYYIGMGYDHTIRGDRLERATGSYVGPAWVHRLLVLRRAPVLSSQYTPRMSSLTAHSNNSEACVDFETC